jgi:hypothetical protein
MVMSEEAAMHTGPIPAIVSAEITLNLVVGAEYGVPVPARFSYSAHDPLSVTAEFHAAGSAVQWVFARDLLQAGTVHPTGDGDVTCWPATISGERVVCIALRSPSGQALLEAPAGAIDEFLQRSYEVVPVGAEGDFLDLDGLIRDLLAE